MLHREPEYRRRIREKTEQNQSATYRERQESAQDARIEKIIGSVERLVKQVDRYADEKSPENKCKRRWEKAEVFGLWAAALMGLIAIAVSTCDADRQRGVMIAQSNLMQGQMDEMKAQNRPWVFISVIQNDQAMDTSRPFNILAFIKNTGRGPALHVGACFGSDTPNIHQQDKAGIDALFKELPPDCEKKQQTVLMPDAQFGYNVSRHASFMTQTVIDDIDKGFATFYVIGRITYEDSNGGKYGAAVCALYLPASKSFNACPSGNETYQGNGD